MRIDEWIKSLCANGHRLVKCGLGLYRCANCRYELRSINAQR